LEKKGKKLKINKVQSIILEGEQVEAYVNLLTRLIDGARLNKFFPDPVKVTNFFNFLIPENNYGFYDKIHINRDTGFPIEKDVSRVIVDKRTSGKTLKEDTEEELEARYKKNRSPVNDRRLRRYRYHRDLASRDIQPLFDIEMKLRMVDTEKYTAFFNNTIDESEFAFILLNDLEHVVVEEVQRCRIGPLYFRGLNIPGGMEEIFEKHPGAFILSLPTDRASIHIKKDKNNDPLTQMYRDALDPGARELRDQKAEMTGYCVYKERKFVCTKNVLTDFRKFLKERNARCVVRGV